MTGLEIQLFYQTKAQNQKKAEFVSTRRDALIAGFA